MRRKALLVGVVAAAALSVSASTTFAQTQAAPVQARTPPPAPAKPTTVQPKWQVQPQPAPVQPLLTVPQTRGYSQFDVLIEPKEWPRQDHAFGNPETPPDRQDNDYGLDSVKAYDSTRPESPLGPY